jgi:hypothetical protein
MGGGRRKNIRTKQGEARRKSGYQTPRPFVANGTHIKEASSTPLGEEAGLGSGATGEQLVSASPYMRGTKGEAIEDLVAEEVGSEVNWSILTGLSVKVDGLSEEIRKLWAKMLSKWDVAKVVFCILGILLAFGALIVKIVVPLLSHGTANK